MDGGAWKAAVHGVAEGRTRLRDFTFTCSYTVCLALLVEETSFFPLYILASFVIDSVQFNRSVVSELSVSALIYFWTL